MNVKINISKYPFKYLYQCGSWYHGPKTLHKVMIIIYPKPQSRVVKWEVLKQHDLSKPIPKANGGR